METRVNALKKQIYDDNPLQEPPMHLEALIDALTALFEDFQHIKSDHTQKFVLKCNLYSYSWTSCKENTGITCKFTRL